MVNISTKKGLNIPISGKASGDIINLDTPPKLALDLSSFEGTKFRLLVKQGDLVKIGQPIAEDKQTPGRYFVSPAGGTIDEVRRGEKRRLMAVVVTLDSEESYQQWDPMDPKESTKESLVSRFLESGIFAHIRMRPFNLLANPQETPKSIFVKALESAPYVPPSEFQVQGNQKAFQAGLNALNKICPENVNLVYSPDSQEPAFTEAQNVCLHTAKGPHPVSNPSVHIHHINPITSIDDRVWTLNAHDVVCIGTILLTGRCHTQRVISIAGPGILSSKRSFCVVRNGHPIGSLIANRVENGIQRYISGDILTGDQVKIEDYLGFSHFCFTVLPENSSREFLHFFKPGFSKYTATKTYASGHCKTDKEFSFTTNQHGEHRAFVDANIYDKVMPMRVPTMLLIKAVISKDFDTAEELGFLEVDSEDFALSTFICPSKIEIVDIMKEALRSYSQEVIA